MSNLIKHLYVHIPFCKSKCPYCDFYSISSANTQTKDQYCSSLIKEFEHHKATLSQPLASLYLGGGSPFMLGMDNLRTLLKVISPQINTTTETTIELNPEHVEDDNTKRELIELLKEGKINRVSLGVQTTNEEIKKLISRKYSLEKLVSLCDTLKENSFNISFDFMFALPDQTLSMLEEDINFIKVCNPHHVSMYLFTPPENYSLINLLPNEETIEQMFNLTHDRLVDMGYSHYEISNYSVKGKESRHNMAYWNRVSYLGLGAAAHSFLENKHTRYWHSKDVQTYIMDPQNIISEKLTSEMEYTETIMLGLRTLNIGVPEEFFKDNTYKALLRDGLLKRREKNIVVPYKHVTILDSIIKELG